MKTLLLLMAAMGLAIMGCNMQPSIETHQERPILKDIGNRANADAEDRTISSAADAAAAPDVSETEDSFIDSGTQDSTENDSGMNSEEGGVRYSQDTGIADASFTNVFTEGNFGTLVIADRSTRVSSYARPAWTHGPVVASARFERQNGKIYTLLVFTKLGGESIADWMQRTDAGDSFLSARTSSTASNQTAYIYETNDYGLVPDVHIILATQNFVYRFHSEETEQIVPDDFVAFVQNARMQ